MEANLNKLLVRQVKKHFGSVANIPEEISNFILDINSTYDNFKDDIALLQNSIEISSQELRSAFLKHKTDAESQKETIKKINQAIQAISSSSENETLISGPISNDSNYLFGALMKLIDERTQAMEDILRLSVAVEQNPASIVITDLNGNIAYVNPKFCDLTGYTKSEVIGKNPKLLKAEDNNPEMYKELWSTILTGNEWKGEFRNKKKNGEVYWELASISAVKNLKGEIVNYLAIKEDITERKKTEEILQNERTLFRTIIDLIPDAVYVKDISGRKTLANPKEIEFSGKKTENEIIGKTDFDLYPEVDALRSAEEDNLVIHSGNSILNVEGTLKDNDGFTHNLLVSKVPLYDVMGTITGLVGVTHDITERKRAEEQLQVAHKSLSDILNAAIYTSIISTDLDGLITVFSPGAEKMLGYLAKEMIGKITPVCFHLVSEINQRSKELSAEFGRSVEGFEVFVTKAKTQEHEERSWTYVRKDGNTILVNLVVTAIRNNKNEITGFLGIASDITQRKKAQEELRRVSTRLTLATLAGGVGVWELDLVNNKLFWDDQMFALYGTEKQGFVSAYETWLAGVHHEDRERAQREIDMAIRGEKDFNSEFRVVWPDGSVHNIRALASVQTDNAGKPHRMIGTNWDITEQKKNEEFLLKARLEAEIANKAKSVFLANMSHEIRTPLNAIIGFSQLMNRDKYLTEIQKEYTNSIIRAGEHLLALINDILELSKMEAGRLELNPVNIDLYSLFADIQMLFKEPARAKHLQFIFDMAPDIPQYVIVDDNKLRRIFVNLIGNAIKFTEEGGIAVRARIDKHVGQPSKLVVEVQDSGPGIAKDEMHKLFKHFVQTSSGIKNSSGTGLGLALSRELARLMNGDITVTSEEGKGSVFTFFTEVVEGKQVKSQFRNRVIGLEKTTEEYRILVADDIEENLQVVIRLLNLVGFKTKEARNGEEAIAIFEDWNPHLILMDMRMPVMDGYAASRIIKSSEKGKSTPIVALTASSFEDEHHKINSLGIEGYIRKPFRENELFETMGNILGLKYIFEAESFENHKIYELNNNLIAGEIANLPDSFVVQMLNAAVVADIDRIIELIHQIDDENAALAKYLLTLANNYDYEFLQQIFSKGEITQ
jgi:PAS domain S-box-containing protein